ncbi:stalk domain-containing protein, partial [Peptoniphilus sp. HMSC075B08]|uniref:stalk domain-containing protein n=1 Tax=Peptoniphilus sp. HMSC075B08 TaxID=1739525 RepID=UPI000B077865
DDNNSDEQPGDKKTTVDDSGKKPVKPTDDKQDTGVKVENKDDDTKISAKDEDGNKVEVEIDEDGKVIVTPGEDVDGPITVVVEDKDLPGGKTEVEIEVEGHKKGQDDNNSDKKPEDGNGTSVDNSNLKPVRPTDEKQDTGIKVENPDKDTKVSAKDEDGKNVPAIIDENGNIVVTPGTDVDGPITVVVEDPDLPGGRVEVEVDVIGHEKGRDDNNNGYPSDGGEYIIPGIRYRDHKTPTFPVRTVYPEKTEAATPVRDTLWYVFRINDFEYDVVRNGVVTKRKMDVTPVLQNDRTMLPLRYVAEALEADVKWDAKTRTATFTKGGLTATIQIDSDEIVLSNGKTVKMDSKPLNINDRILVSVTNVANVFGLTNGNTLDKIDQDIEWEQEDKSATIYIRR